MTKNLNIFENLTLIEIIRKCNPYRNISKFSKKIEIFRIVSPKSKFFENSTDQNRNFYEISEKSKFFDNLTKTEIFRKLKKNWNFSYSFTKIEIFRKFDRPKSKFLRNFEKSKFFDIWPKSKFFENCTKSKFFEILTKIEIIWNFDQNLNFSIVLAKSQFF